VTAFFLFDTSALVKRYHLEPGSDKVDEIFEDTDNVLIISELALVEVTSALLRKRNQGEITASAMENALAQFARDVLSELIVADLTSDLVHRAREMVLKHNLRTLDALQLAFALEFQVLKPTFVCADAKLRDAAQAAGITTLDPEAP
jgi:predicted nucleic acid-binding protein